MSHIITIDLRGDIEALFEDAKRKAASMGVALNGDITAGDFSGLGATGNYSVDGQILTIEITRKPAMFPQAMLDAMVRKLFE
ncbi:MAG TPA: hypothetical protein ENN84_05500 [Candidatus Marinimicrobia bacterium]|nr:hypothetical protein [Candidatus Neomarinimicrobiota bacterium]